MTHTLSGMAKQRYKDLTNATDPYPVGLRLPLSLYNALREAAILDGRSVNEEAVRAIIDGLHVLKVRREASQHAVS